MRKLIKGVNDLESQYPEIAKQWDLEKNEGVKPNEVFAHSNIILIIIRCRNYSKL